MITKARKRLIDRVVSFLTACTMSFNIIPVPEFVGVFTDIIQNIDYVETYDEAHTQDNRSLSISPSSAADNPYIREWNDLEAYAAAYNSDNQNDTIYIQCNAGMDVPSDFIGIGTSEAPFKGQVKILNVLNDNGGDSLRMRLSAPLFNYISDEATITDSNGNSCTLYLYPDSMGNRPLFANHVAGTGGSANWSIKVSDVGNGVTQVNARSSLIGDIYNKTDDPNVTISYYNQSAAISGNGNLGLICNTLSAGILTVSFPNGSNGIAVPSVSTTNGNVGGIIGEMGTGTELKINSSINLTSSRIISTSSGYAGGLVGYCKGTVTFGSTVTYADNNSSTITGSTGAGGLYGCLEISASTSIDLSKYSFMTVQDANAPGEGIKATGGNSNVGGFIGELVNKGTDANSVTILLSGGNSIPNSPTINVTLSAAESNSNGGGLIGLYHSDSLKNTLAIDHLNLKTGGVKIKEYYGGLIGKVESTNDCGSYISICDVTSESNYFHSIDQYKLNNKSAGIVCSIKNDFIDVSGAITLKGRVEAGLIYNTQSGVLRLAGTTDLSTLTIDSAILADNRANTLIYALGNGSDYNSSTQIGWTYKRPAPTNDSFHDDISPWGQVVRFVSTTPGSTTNNVTLEDASVVSVNMTSHTVTLQDASKAIATSADYAKTSLNIQLNTTGNDFGALIFASHSNINTSLLADDLTITNNITLSETGLIGLTRDNVGDETIDGSPEFTGTLKPTGDYTISLAIGESYGYKANTLAVSVTADNGNRHTGAIISHALNGLFAKLGECTIGDSSHTLTIGGRIIATSATSHNIGGLAAQLFDGDATVQNVKCNETIDVNGGGSKSIGMLIGSVLKTTHKVKVINEKGEETDSDVVDGDPESLTIDTVEMNGVANVYSTKVCAGLIGKISDASLESTFNNITLKGNINYQGDDRPYVGGLIGATSSTSGYNRNISLNNINVNGLSVSTNMTANATVNGKFENPAGGLLGGQWLNTNVIFGSKTDVSKSVKITNGTVALSGNASYVGGLVSDATGYWQINDIDVTAMNITGASDGIGLIVLNGKNSTNGLYLEMTSAGSYSLPNNFVATTTAPAVVYDEIMAFSKGVDYLKTDSTVTGMVPSESNGQAIISIRTTNDTFYTVVSPTPTYSGVTPDGSENPSSEGWYERTGTEGNYSYTISEDSTVDSEKQYFEIVYSQNPSSEGWYELTGGSYTSTSDTTVDLSKTYYEQKDQPRLSMNYNLDNSYSPKTTLGQNHNPFSRYYYNLDYLLPNASTGGEKLLLWSVQKYAAKNISKNTKVTSEHSNKGFLNYKSFPEANSICDLSYLSYYPIDIYNDDDTNGFKDGLSIPSGITVKLYNSEMQAAHGGTYDLNGFGSQSQNSQHFLMHASLFKDVRHTLSITDMTLQGNISSHGASEAGDVSAGSGAIACGTIYGATGSIVNVTINGLTLDGIKVNTNSGIDALIIKKVGGNTAISINDVRTSVDGYSSYSSTDYAANYLIGDAEGTSMTFNFSEMVLDSRTTANSSAIYDPSAASGTAKDLNDAYHTKKSIFKDATFFHSLKYTKGSGSSAKYNYDWSEDWGTTKHQVTYAKEISETTENNKLVDGVLVNQQTKYADRKTDSSENEYYTSPESNSLISNAYDFSDFLPHVAVAYNNSTNNHEVAVNIVNAVLEEGCGTYNDPYIIDDGERLEVIARALNDITTTGGFDKGFYVYINKAYANNKMSYFTTYNTSDAAKDRWCDANEDYKFKYNGTNFVCTSPSKTLTVQEVKNYLAGAYYYIDGNIVLSSSFVGLGGNVNSNAFRGVIVGGPITEEGTTSYPVITNNSEFPLIKKSNGSVVKNVTVYVDPDDDITLTAPLAGSSATTGGPFGYSENENSTQYYGGIIGEIMGGDNIIDNVSVVFQNSKSIILDDSGAGACNIPAGAYVGVIVNGSLMFRNMTASMTSTATTGFHAYAASDTLKSVPLEVDVVLNSDGTESFTNLYINPIVGRVINGFAINETDTYRYSEDGKYLDYYSAERTTARAAAVQQVTLKNGRKNFSIPDFNSVDFNQIVFSKSDEGVAADYNDNVTIKDAQSLYIISLICQTNMGSAPTDGGEYGTRSNSGYDANSKNYKATHLAKYDNVKVSGITKTDSDFVNTKYELANSKVEIPYLIYKYTPGTTSNGKYAARTLATSTRTYNIIIDETSDSILHLPDSFRGIGYLGSDNAGYMTIKTFNGNSKKIDVNTYFRSYSWSVDNYHTKMNTGIALFNTAKQDAVNATNGVPSNDSKAFKDFTLQGCISAKRADSDNTLISGYENSTTAYWRVGGIISHDANSQTYNFDNVDFENLNLDGSYNAGALLASVNATTVYANNCDATNLKITGTRQLGGYVGLSGSGNYFINMKDNAESSSLINIHEMPTAEATNAYVGGVLGEHTGGELIVKNMNIVGWNGSFNASSTKKPFIGRDVANNEVINQGSSVNGTSLYVGGVVGKISSSNNVIDNVNVYGVNIYGYAVGGILGGATDDNSNHHIENCGLHGKSDSNVTISTDTYELRSFYEAGGLIGYSHNPYRSGTEDNNTTTFSINNIAYTKGYIGGALVDDYTIKQTNTNDALCSVGGIIGVARNKKYIRDSKVDNCILSSYGGKTTKIGGIVGEFTKYHIYGYNLSVINNTFDPVLTEGSNLAQYGLIVGGKTTDKPNQILISGFTSYGNKITAPFGGTSNKTDENTMLIGNRNVEFVYGRPYNKKISEGFYRNDFSTTYASSDIDNAKDSMNPYSYIVYSDYLHKSKESTAGTAYSTVNNTNNVDEINETSFPYVTTSPYAGMGNVRLTGDGVYLETGENDSITVMADKIVKDRETAVPTSGSEIYDATVYKNFSDTDLKVYKAFKNSGKISTFNKQAGTTVLNQDIPLIVLDDATFSVEVDGNSYGYSDILKSYIRILTNSSYRFDGGAADLENQVYNIEIKKCRYNNSAFSYPEGVPTLQFTNGNFSMTSSYDSSSDGQFTVIDVQFYDPGDYDHTTQKRTKVAYHLYIPVYTKKAFNFKFHASALSGTTYDKTAYEDGLQAVVENYGTPVTMFIRYEYSVSDIVNDILGGGYGLDWNYNKILDIYYNYSRNGSLPSNTRFVLIDVNQNDKANYTTLPLANGDLSINGSVFSGHTNGDHYDYTAYSVIEFDDLLEKNGISFTPNELLAANVENTTDQIFISVAQNAERSGKFKIGNLTLAPATPEEKTVGLNLYTLSYNKDKAFEDYYLTIYAPADSGDVRHQVTINSMENLSSDNKIKATCKSNDNVLLVFANLFDKSTVIKTMEGEGDMADKLMSLEAKDTIQLQAISTIKFDSVNLDNQLNEVIDTLNGSRVKVYHSTQLQFSRIDTSSATTIAVDGTQFSLVTQGGGSIIANNSGVYVKISDNYVGQDSYFDENDTNHDYPYKQVINCNSSNALVGKREANFYEIINKTTSGEFIDLRPYLTGDVSSLTGTGDLTGITTGANEVKIVTNFTMRFTANGISDQFAERPRDNGSEGTVVYGQSSLAYSASGTTYSKNKTLLSLADPSGRKYYRKALSKTSLSFEVWNSDELANIGAKNKSNNSLGINPFPYLGSQDIEDDKATITTMGVYDAMQLNGAENATDVTWTLELYSRQRKIENGSEIGVEYGDPLPINEFLTNIQVYGVIADSTSKSSSPLSVTSSTSTTLTYKYPRNNFEDMTVKVNAEDTTTNKFIIYVDFDVITGNSLESAEKFYSNYKVVLSAKLDEDATSKAINHIIYTNAKLDPTFIEVN